MTSAMAIATGLVEIHPILAPGFKSRMTAQMQGPTCAVAAATGAKAGTALSAGLLKGARAATAAGRTLTRTVTLPILAIGAASVHMATDFQASMERIHGLVGVSQRQVDVWSKQLLALGPSVGKSPKELADALYFITSAGLRGSKAIDVLTMSAKAAAAGLGETKTVADAVTSAINAYAGTGLKASNVTDILVAAVREGKMPVEDLAGAIGQVLPIASEVGVSFQEVAGTAAALSRVGAPVAKTMTGIRFLLTNLIKPSASAANALDEVGLSAQNIRESIREKGLLDTLQILKDRLPIDDFMKVVGGARGVIVSLGLVGKNGKMSADVMRKVADATGSTNRAFGSASKTAKLQFAKAFASLQANAIRLGAVLLPVVAKIVGGITKLVEWFRKLPGPVRSALGWLLGITAVVGPILLLAGNVIILVDALSKIGIVCKLASIAWGALNVVFAISPIGWIVIAVGALIAVFVLLWKKCKWFRDFWKGLWHEIKNVFASVAVIILTGIKWWITGILTYFGWLIHGAAKLFGWVPGLGKALRTADSAFQRFKGNVGKAFDNVIDKIRGFRNENERNARSAEMVADRISVAFGKQARAAKTATVDLGKYSDAIKKNGVNSQVADTARDKLLKDLLEAGIDSKIAKRDLDRYTDAIRKNGTGSQQAKQARQQLNRDLEQAFKNSQRGKRDIDAYTAAVRKNGSDSRAAQGPRKRLIDDLVKTGMSSKDARNLVERLTAKILGIPENRTTKIHMRGDGSYTISGFAPGKAGAIAKQYFGNKYGPRAKGGPIFGPGGPTSDLVPVMASNREWVIQARSAEYYGPRAMAAINAGTAVVLPRLPRGNQVALPMFAAGGRVLREGDQDVLSGRYGEMAYAHHWTTVKDAYVTAMRKHLADAKAKAEAMYATQVAVGGSGVTRWTGTVQRALRMLGQSLAWTSAVLARIRMESGGNPNAINLWDINAQRGDPSRGLIQTIGSTFRSYHVAGTSWNIYNPLANVAAGIHYALHRYGGLWVMTRPGGYGKGGPVLSYDKGGRINESIFGIGRSGQQYRFHSGETVVPQGGNTYQITVNVTPLSNPAEVGAAVIKVIKAHESRSGKGWRS